MTRVRARGEEIRRFILRNVQANPGRISKLAIDKFHISRQAVNQHLTKLVSQGALRVTGKTRAKVYELAPMVEWSQTYLLRDRPAEDVVWRDDVQPMLRNLPDNVQEVWAHGFTEMFNNARDHSEGSSIHVSVKMSAVTTEMMVMDDGVGIFRKIQTAMHLLDERHAIFELSKGKLTTDPSRHTGEGIFFTSRMFDGFDILSGGVFFSHEYGTDEDWLMERENPTEGTSVFMKLDNHTARTTREIFDQYSSDADDCAFTKTVVPVKLAQYGNDKLISRSQAKRVMARVELFRTVVLDFEHVPSIGQSFADEVFRVFALDHPQIRLIPINASSEVKRMIARASGGLRHTDPPREPDETS
jgi:anti-sigma regulatory factor (Ser/Thr protein kinase)